MRQIAFLFETWVVRLRYVIVAFAFAGHSLKMAIYTVAAPPQCLILIHN
jgi:hypothetical protein